MDSREKKGSKAPREKGRSGEGCCGKEGRDEGGSLDSAMALTEANFASFAYEDGMSGSKRLPLAWVVDKMPYVPLAFLGLALYRVWIELIYVGSFIPFPYDSSAIHNYYDIAMIITLFLCAALHRRIEPIFRSRVFYVAVAVFMLAGTVGMFAGLCGHASRACGIFSVVTGGVGTAGIILLWSELYASLSPYRVGLYYSASIVAAACVLYLCRGLLPPWQFGMAMLLPLGSLVFVALGFIGLPPAERPHASTARFSFPWKPVLIMAVYAFAYGLRELSQYDMGIGPHSSPGALVVGVLLFLWIYLRGSTFDFSYFYRVALPLMMGAFLVLPAFGTLNEVVSDCFATASYTAFSVLIMLILANMSYRYGMSAVWLFGIERGVRALFAMGGRYTAQGLALVGDPDTNALVIGVITVALVVIGTLLFTSEKDFSSRWGVSFRAEGASQADLARMRREDRALRCDELAGQFGLSPREREVLQLLARRRTVGQIQTDLVVSKDTVKTHVKHIYRKMDIHSRAELFDLLGMGEEE